MASGPSAFLGATLVFSSIGYKDVEIVVGSQNVYNVTLEEDKMLLDEVVVVGYGTMKRSDLSGASVSMNEESLKGSIVSSLDQTLEGTCRRCAGRDDFRCSGFFIINPCPRTGNHQCQCRASLCD